MWLMFFIYLGVRYLPDTFNFNNIEKVITSFETVEVPVEKGPTIESEIISLVNQGRSYVKAGKFDDALVYYSKALALNPNDSFARDNMNALQSYIKQAEDQIVVYKKAIEVDPHDYYAYESLIDWNIDLYKYEEARKFLDTAYGLGLSGWGLDVRKERLNELMNK